MFYITLILGMIVSLNAVKNNCHPACGGDSDYNCADFSEEESSDKKCYSCAAGYIGGTGRVDGVGAKCEEGKCHYACAACLSSATPNACYLCSYGFYDPVFDPTVANPCVRCHSSCLSCAGPNSDQCLTCSPGYFDAINNPYTPGTCEKCNSNCSNCRNEFDQCTDGCCAVGFKRDTTTGKCDFEEKGKC